MCVMLAVSSAAQVDEATFTTTCPGADLLPDAINQTQVARATTCLLNRIRGAAGLGALRTRAALSQLAAVHTRDMIARRVFGHGDFHGRLASIGWRAEAGENIGFGTFYYATPRSMVWAWMRSPKHRENVLNPAFHYIGIAVAAGAPVPVTGPAATYTADFGGALTAIL